MMNAFKQFAVWVFIFVLIGSAIPASARAQSPEPSPTSTDAPLYFPSIGHINGVQSAQASQVCAIELQPLPETASLTVTVPIEGLTIHSWLPLVSAQQECSGITGDVFVGNQRVVDPFSRGDMLGLRAGPFPSDQVNYSINPQLAQKAFWEPTRGSLPVNSDLQVLGAWRLGDTTTAASPAEFGNIWGELNIARGNAADKLVTEGKWDGTFWLPGVSNASPIPQHNSSMMIAAVCQGNDPFAMYAGKILGVYPEFEILDGNPGIDVWAFVQWEGVNGCEHLRAYPWVLFIQIWHMGAIGTVAERLINQEADAATRIWPVELGLQPVRPGFGPVPFPRLNDAEMTGVVWGGVVFVAVILVVGAVTAQPEIWIFALVPI